MAFHCEKLISFLIWKREQFLDCAPITIIKKSLCNINSTYRNFICLVDFARGLLVPTRTYTCSTKFATSVTLEVILYAYANILLIYLKIIHTYMTLSIVNFTYTQLGFQYTYMHLHSTYKT